MDVGDVRPVTTGGCTDLYLVETGMFDVTGYGGVYVLDAHQPAIIETGIGTNHEVILGALAELGIAPESIGVIAVTHVHLDHAGGAGFLAEACENATVIAHERGAPHLVDPDRLVAGTKAAVGDAWQYYTDPLSVPADRVRSVTDGDRIDLSNHTLDVLSVPGHAPHQVAFADDTMRAVFTGDAAGIWIADRERVCETSPPPDFDLAQAVADLGTLRGVEPETLLYTHFGPADDAMRRLDAYEETITAWIERVDRVRIALEDDAAVLDHFAERTDLGDIWSEEKARAEMCLNVTGALHYLEQPITER